MSVTSTLSLMESLHQWINVSKIPLILNNESELPPFTLPNGVAKVMFLVVSVCSQGQDFLYRALVQSPRQGPEP